MAFQVEITAFLQEITNNFIQRGKISSSRNCRFRKIPEAILTCSEARDYANPIEPSVAGGEKIVNVIMNVLLEHDFKKPYTQVFY